jgi:uncharacterized membrane protein
MRIGARAKFSAAEEASLVQAIEAAERQTSAEIRIHIEGRCPGYELDRASELFATLRMHETEARNGVLLYLAIQDRKFGVIGDSGIHQFVGDAFWESVYGAARPLLARGDWEAGLRSAVHQVGEALRTHFPRKVEDVNELNDAISWGW